MKKNIWKRLLSLALALVMVAGWLPHMATEAHAASGASTTVTIDGLQYTISFTKLKWSGSDRTDTTSNLNINGRRNGNTVQFGITFKYVHASGQEGNVTQYNKVDQFSFTDSNCAGEVNASVKNAAGSSVQIELKITREASSHTGGTSCSSPKCTRCGTAYIDHNYSYQSDATHHWQVCANDASHTTAKQQHSGGSPTCTTSAACTTCNTKYYADHTFDTTKWEWANDKHYNPCTTDGCSVRGNESDCSYSELSCTQDKKCSVCEHVKAYALDHKYTYAMEGNVLVETCPNGCGHEATATFETTLTYNGKEQGEHIPISYSENWEGGTLYTHLRGSAVIDAGEYTMFVGKKYNSELGCVDVTIQPYSLDGEAITVEFAPANPKYNGQEQKPEVTVKFNDKKLVVGTDYEAVWDKDSLVNAGTYCLTITGKGNFGGSRDAGYTIGKADEYKVPFLMDMIVPKGVTYDGKAHPVTVSAREGCEIGEFIILYDDESDGRGNGSPNPPVDAGKYYVTVDIAESENNIEIKGAGYASLTIAQADGSATVSVDDLVYGETITPVISSTNGTENVIYQYALKGTENYSDTVPTQTGDYTVKATFPETRNYKAAVAYDDFTIRKADPGIGVVTADVVNDTLETSAIVLTRANEDVQGDLIVDAGQTLAWGENTIRYTFTPNDTANYTIVTGDVAVTVKDTIAPTGTVTISTRSWAEFLNSITFGLFFKETQTVSIIADDNLSEVAKVEYYASAESLTLENVQTITNWTEYNGEFSVTLEDAKRFVYYVRITDNADNVTYISSDGAEYDITAPVIDGVDNGATYYTTQKVTVSDKNIATVTLNGEEVSESITLEGSKDATYTIVATDKAGNSTTVTVTMKPISTLAAPIDALTEDNVNSGDEQAVDGIKAAVAAVDTIKATEEEKAALKEITDKAEALKKVIDETKAEIARINEELSKYDAATVNSDDPPVLEQLAKDIKKLLDGDNLTDAERTAFTEAAEDVADMQKTVADTTAENQRISDAADGYDITTVTSGDKADLEKLLADIDKQLESTNLTDEEISGLNGDKKAVEDLLAKIAGVDELIDKLIEDVNEYSDDTVKSTDQEAIEQMIDDIEVVLETDNLTEDEEKALEDARDKAEGMLETIEEASKATDTDNTEKVEDVTADNVTPDDKSDLEKAKADLEDALENNGGNYTDDEKKAIEDEVKRIEDALEVIGNVEAVEELIGKIPATVTKNAEAAIKAADKAYNALSDYEKSLVDKDAKKALEKAEAALAELQKEETPDTGDDTNLYLWFILVLASGMCIFGIALNELKRKAAARR